MSSIDWKDGLNLERDSAIILQKQEENGVCFDTNLAHKLVESLENLKAIEEKVIRPYLKAEIVNMGSVSKIFLKNGSYTASVLNHFPEDPQLVEGEFTRICIEEPSITKRKVVIKQLLSLGWKPTLFTDKGQPKLTEKGLPVESLSLVGDFGESLGKYYTYCHRQSQIIGLIGIVRRDGRVSAGGMSVGTNTFRMTHRGVVNIPRVGSLFGEEMRSLFKAADGKVLVTVDLSGIELRILAHYMKDDEYTNQILDGDIHLYNAIKSGLLCKSIIDSAIIKLRRNLAKTFIYAWLYGAGDSKIGSIVGGSSNEGKKLKATFLEQVPALSDLLNRARKYAERNGFIPSLDGRKVFIRSFEGRLLLHTVLNTLFQSGGSVVAKRFMVLTNDKLESLNIDFKQVLFMHDEISIECNPEDAELVGKVMLDSVREAGEYYKMRIRLDGECKIGNNWSETH